MVQWFAHVQCIHVYVYSYTYVYSYMYIICSTICSASSDPKLFLEVYLDMMQLNEYAVLHHVPLGCCGVADMVLAIGSSCQDVLLYPI